MILISEMSPLPRSEISAPYSENISKSVTRSTLVSVLVAGFLRW